MGSCISILKPKKGDKKSDTIQDEKTEKQLKNRTEKKEQENQIKQEFLLEQLKRLDFVTENTQFEIEFALPLSKDKRGNDVDFRPSMMLSPSTSKKSPLTLIISDEFISVCADFLAEHYVGRQNWLVGELGVTKDCRIFLEIDIANDKRLTLYFETAQDAQIFTHTLNGGIVKVDKNYEKIQQALSSRFEI